MVEMDFTTRADELSTGGTPLRKFKGKLIGSDENSNRIFPTQKEQREGQSKIQYVVNLNFIDLDVIESVTPWAYPVVQLGINYNPGRDGAPPSDRGGWGLFLKSVEELGIPDAQELVGKVMTLEAEPAHSYGNNQETGEAITGIVWRVTEIEGGESSQVSAEEEVAHMIDLIHGKDRGQFSEIAMQDGIGRKFSKEIMDGTLVASLLASGGVEQDGEIFWAKGRDRA